MPYRSKRSKATVRIAAAESLEWRTLFTSTSILFDADFNTTNPWSAMSAVASAGGSATVSRGAFGTIDTAGGVTPTGAINFTANAPSTGPWSSTVSSGQFSVTNSETNLAKLTLSFTLAASQAYPVKLILYSYNSSSGLPTGGLETLIYPAASNYNQRFAVDLSTMKPSGGGTFAANASYLSVNYQINSLMGWTASNAAQLNVDNVNYSKPAYYVSPSGNNTTGLTEATAFHTPQQAVNVSQPGDIILIMAGTYVQPNSYTGPIVITKGGTPADWVVLKNYPGQSPEIYNQYWNAILIGNGTSSNPSTAAAIGYLEIRGLDVHGNADIAATAYNSSIGAVDARTNGNGINVNGGSETNRPHDLRFANNIVEYNCGGGIGVGDADHIQIENNVVRYNSWWTIYATSGISILSAYNFDGTTNNYTRVVCGNTVYGNQCYEKWASQNPPIYSDGNGIIMDINHNDSALPNSVTVGRTLVNENVSFNNGGGGIHAYKANHVDMFNNVAYMNSASPYLQYPEMDGNNVSDVRIYNNIMVAPVANVSGGQTAEPVNGGSASFFQNNLYYGGNTAPVMGSGDRVLDAKFVSPSIDPATADFRVQSSSPAINSANAFSPAVDFLNNVRNGVPDIGAYEYFASIPTIVTPPFAYASPVTGNSTLLNVLAGDNDGPAALTYTWAVTNMPSGAITPTFSANNGTSVANTLAATFSRAGSYTFSVTVTDANANSATGSVTVVVNQTAASIAVSPNSISIAGGATQPYTASGIDQFGQAMTPNVTWATTTGTISSSGILTAGQTGGSFAVSASSAGVLRTASVYVVPTSYSGNSLGYYLRMGADNITEQIWVGSPGSVGPAFSTPTYSIPLANVPSLSFGPGTGPESFTIDLSNGTPVPIGGLSVDGGAGSDTFKVIGSVGNDTVTINSTQVLFGSTPVSIANLQSIILTLGTGSDTLIQSAQPGNGVSVLWTDPTSSDSLNVSGGTYTIPASTAGLTKVSLATLNVANGAALVLGPPTTQSTRIVLVLGTLSLAPSATLNVAGNDLIIGATTSDLTAAAFTALTSGTGTWGSPGLTTSAPAGNPLRALGFAISTGSSFDGQNTSAGSILVKTTYFGDANLDGKVDGSDYSRIDNGFINGTLTGWYNGDFNYDGVVNGSDYTLIDNAFNSQGASMAAGIANTIVQPVDKATVFDTGAKPTATRQSIDHPRWLDNLKQGQLPEQMEFATSPSTKDQVRGRSGSLHTEQSIPSQSVNPDHFRTKHRLNKQLDDVRHSGLLWSVV